MNEAQMILHTHPVNAEREARGMPAVNSVWLWGGGTLPAITPPSYTTAGAAGPCCARWRSRRASRTATCLPAVARTAAAGGQSLAALLRPRHALRDVADLAADGMSA